MPSIVSNVVIAAVGAVALGHNISSNDKEKSTALPGEVVEGCVITTRDFRLRWVEEHTQYRYTKGSWEKLTNIIGSELLATLIATNPYVWVGVSQNIKTTNWVPFFMNGVRFGLVSDGSVIWRTNK